MISIIEIFNILLFEYVSQQNLQSPYVFKGLIYLKSFTYDILFLAVSGLEQRGVASEISKYSQVSLETGD